MFELREVTFESTFVTFAKTFALGVISLLVTLSEYGEQYVALPIMTKVVSYVRELPDKTSDIIEKVEEGIKGVATEEEPYWIKITWEDSSGEKKTGWIAKRNVYFDKEEENKSE